MDTLRELRERSKTSPTNIDRVRCQLFSRIPDVSRQGILEPWVDTCRFRQRPSVNGLKTITNNQ
jgi:hypothetical protein